jgi:hypothetical protein
LSASTEIWIRLYEAALERAKGGAGIESVPAQTSTFMN